MELHDEEKNSRPVGLLPSKKDSSQRPLAEPVSAVPARRLPPREGCAPSFRLKIAADLWEKDRSSPTFGSCDDTNPMGEGQQRAQIPEAEKKPKQQANQRLFYRAASTVIRAINANVGGQQEDPEQSISPSPDSAQQKTISARWNDKSDTPKRQSNQHLLYGAASMQDLASKVSDLVDKDILDDDGDEMTAMVDDGGNQPSKKEQETIERFSQSCMNLNFEYKTSDGPEVEVFRKSKAQIDDDEPEIEVFRPSLSQRRMSSSSRNLKRSMAHTDNDEHDESDVKVLHPSPSQRRLSSSSSQRRLLSSSSQRRLSSSSSQRRLSRSISKRRLSSSSSQRRLSTSSSQRRLSTSSRRPLQTQEKEHSCALQRSLTDLSPPSRSSEDRWAGDTTLEKSLTDLAPQTRPSEARRVRSSDLARTKDLERSLTELEISLTDLTWTRSSEDKSRPNLERSWTDLAQTPSANWERSFAKFERSISDLGLARSKDVQRSLSELKRSLTDLALSKLSERSLAKLGQASSSADLRDNASCSSISVDDVFDQHEATQALHNDGTRPVPVSPEKEDLPPKRPTKREQQEDTSESWDGEPCDSRHFESSLVLSSIYIMSDLKNESNSSIHHSSEEIQDSKLAAERIPEVEQEKEWVESAGERRWHDSSNSSFRINTSRQGSFGHASSTSLASSIGAGSRSRAPQEGREQSHRTSKEEHRNRCAPAPTPSPASRVRRAPSRSYSAYSGANSFLDDIEDVSDEEEASAADRTKEKKSDRRGRRRDETNDAMLARIERETAKQDLHKSLDGSYQFQL
jgi:hypothetical protein